MIVVEKSAFCSKGVEMSHVRDSVSRKLSTIHQHQHRRRLPIATTRWPHRRSTRMALPPKLLHHQGTAQTSRCLQPNERAHHPSLQQLRHTPKLKAMSITYHPMRICPRRRAPLRLLRYIIIRTARLQLRDTITRPLYRSLLTSPM